MPRKKQHIFINTRMTTYEKLRGTSTHELAILGVDMPGIGKISILSGMTGMLERREVQECCIYCVPLTSEKGRVRYVHLTGPDALAEDLLTPGLWISVPVHRFKDIWVANFNHNRLLQECEERMARRENARMIRVRQEEWLRNGGGLFGTGKPGAPSSVICPMPVSRHERPMSVH